jgi:hypothetical protein
MILGNSASAPASARAPDRSDSKRRGRKKSAKAALDSELERIPTFDRALLVQRFVSLCGFRPPARFSRKLMELAVAYQMQEKVYGGLKPSTRRLLLGSTEPAPAARKGRRTQTKLKPGTILIREWQGVTYEVTVLEEGFLHRNKRYRSLSEIASVITGAHWSGPTFFGLKKLAATRDHERQ